MQKLCDDISFLKKINIFAPYYIYIRKVALRKKIR